MYERIVEIIVYVMAELRQNKEIADINIEELKNRGYTKSEISTAFSWIVDRYELTDKYTSSDGYINTKSFRILHEAERELFTIDALGELLQLSELGLINNEHIELLIERTIMTGMQLIDTAQLKSFVANIIFSAQHNNSTGSKLMLSGNDTIN